MKCIFMYNPNSGKGKINKKYNYIVNRLKEKFSQVDVFATSYPKQMTEEAAKACGTYDYLVFAGGDGTFNEVVQGVAPYENRPVLGYIPTGTVNDIAHTYKISRRIRGAVNNILNGAVKEVDIFKINDCYAKYVVTAGAFTSSTYEIKQSEKKKFGRLAYFFDGIRRNLKHETFAVQLECGGESVSTYSTFVIIINSKSVAGLKINKRAVLDDGIVEGLIVMQRPNPKLKNRIAAFFEVIKIFIFGYSSIIMKDKKIIKMRGDRFHIKVADDICWNFDGEKGISGEIDISVLRKHLKLIVPKNVL